MNKDNTAAEAKEGQPEIDEALQQIRESMNNESNPDTDILDLTESVDEDEQSKIQKESIDASPNNTLEDASDQNTASFEAQASANSINEAELLEILKNQKSEETANAVKEPEQKLVEDTNVPDNTLQSPATNSNTQNSSKHTNDNETLVDPEAERRITDTMKNLLNAAGSTTKSSITVEELARQVLQKEMREWLNSHLSDIVERIVKAEIKQLIQRLDK